MNSLFNQHQVVYIMDASSLIEAYHSYPMENFLSLWDKFGDLIKGDRLKMPELVFDEVKDEGIKKWYKEKKLKPYIRLTIDYTNQYKVRDILSKYRTLVNSKTGKSGGDPWIIALAQNFQNSVVVTQENPSGNEDRPKIPNVCKDLGIECIKIVDLIKRENWIFR